MPGHSLFGFSKEALIAAQWEVVRAFRHAAEDATSSNDARRIIRQALNQLRASYPEEWARQAMEALITLVAQYQEAASRSDRAAVTLSARCEYLQGLVNEHWANPLHERIKHLTEERDHWHSMTERLADRNRSLDGELHYTRGEIARLEDEIKALNRIIVGQQEALNGASV